MTNQSDHEINSVLVFVVQNFLKRNHQTRMRIFIVGGSTTYGSGDGVENHNTIPSLSYKIFIRTMNLTTTHKQVEVINAGINVRAISVEDMRQI